VFDYEDLDAFLSDFDHGQDFVEGFGDLEGLGPCHVVVVGWDCQRQHYKAMKKKRFTSSFHMCKSLEDNVSNNYCKVCPLLDYTVPQIYMLAIRHFGTHPAGQPT
jgi:hypothetical protein